MTTSQHSRVRAYVAASPRLSFAMHRVAGALSAAARTAGVEITMMEEEADIIILHVIGYPETVAAIESIKARGKSYAMIQYCLRSTQKPNTHDWLPLWTDPACVAVWSYYDLSALMVEDGYTDDDANVLRGRFYFAPMGVDPRTFRKYAASGRVRPYRMLTSGYAASADSEAIQECAEAVALIDGARMFHLGPGFTFFGPSVTQEESIGDPMLVDVLNRSEYVAGLRRCEGFEMVALEGLLCGARPICFDRPHYRQWFGDHAEYIAETSDYANTVEQLRRVLSEPARPVTDDERAVVVARFAWSSIAAGFWKIAAPDACLSIENSRLRLLWVGDAVCASGFARATHHVLNALIADYDIAVLGINYIGDPHDFPYKIYPALNPHGREPELFGVKRIAEVAIRHNADVVIIQQDPWNFPAYIDELRKASISVPVIGFVAVDGRNCDGQALNKLDAAIFWTRFGLEEARDGGFVKPAYVVPLGVDRSVYVPMPRLAARRLLELPRSLDSAFIVGNVNRNQPRKRLDLTIAYFCEWVHEYKHNDAYLFLHVAPTGDVGWNIKKLMHYYGGTRRLVLSEPDPGQGLPESTLAAVYSSFDVQVTTTAGEGWGLPTLEGMACGVPQIVPDWAALGEWPGDGVVKIRCSSVTHTPNGINVVGGVPDKTEFIEALQALKTDRVRRDHWGQRAFDRASDPMFDWRVIGEEFRAKLAMLIPTLLSGDKAATMATVNPDAVGAVAAAAD